MGSIAVIEATVDTQTSTASGDDDFVEVVRTQNLVEGKVYHVICSASVETSNSTDLFEWRLYDNSNAEVVADSTTIRKQAQSGQPQSYYYVGQITAGSETIPNASLAFQQKGYASPDYRPARTNFVSMLLLEMSDMDSGDYFFATEQNNVQVQNTFRDRVSHTITGVEEDDEWLVFAWTMYYMNNDAHSLISRIACDDEDTTDPEIMFEGEDTEEELGWWWCRSYVMSGDNSSVEWKVEDKRDSGTTSHHYCKRTTLFGIKLSSLADSYQSYTASGKNPTATGFFELETTNFTTTSASDVVIVASSIFDAGGTNRKAGQRIQRDGITIPNTQPDDENFLNSNDATDELPLSYVTFFDDAKKDHTYQIDYDVRSSVGTSSVEFDQYTLAVFGTTTVVDPITFTAIAKQVYTSGDVETETFDAGSKATQGFASGDVASQGFASGDTATQSHSSGDVEAEANP